MNIRRITDAHKRYKQDVKAACMQAVVEGGGIWVGIQEGGIGYQLVLFNSPTTGSTLALRTTQITAQLVRSHIAASDKTFERNKHNV